MPHWTEVQGELQREIEIVLDTNLTTNTNGEIRIDVRTSPETESSARSHIPVKASYDVPTPLIGAGEVEIVVIISTITISVPTEIQLNAVEVGEATKMERSFNTIAVSTAETETDSVLFAVTLCHSCCAKSENSNQCNDKFFHSLFLCY